MSTFSKRKSPLLFLLIGLMFSGCVTIFKTETQNDVKVATKNEDPETKVTVKTKEDTGKGSVTLDLKRRNKPFQAVLLKDGYKDAYRVVYSDKFGAGTVICLALDIGTIWTFLPLLDFNPAAQRKYHNYRSPFYLEPPQVKIPKKEESERYLVYQSTSLNLDEDDTAVVEYEDAEAYRNGAPPEDVQFRTDSINAENVVNDSIINDLLVTIGYQDTAEDDEEIILNDYNSVDLTSEVDRFILRKVGKRGSYMKAEVTVNWELKDNYGDALYDTTITSISDDISQHLGSFVDLSDVNTYNVSQSAWLYPVRVAVKDAMKKSLIELVKGDEVSELLKEGGQRAEEKGMAEMDPIRIERGKTPEKNGNMNQQIKGVVTVQKDEESHGSGCIISKDGYVLTNYHVVAGKDTVDVLFDTETKKEGVLKRKSKVMDLALIKVDTSGLSPLTIKEDDQINVGSSVMAIGTPQNIQLGKSVSKGIVSGERTFNELDYIQTDVSINAGNSGGALIDKASGKMIGIVTAKMFGIGVEGIGFAVPAHQALEKLKVEYAD